MRSPPPRRAGSPRPRPAPGRPPSTEREDGFSLLEIAIALAVLAIGLAALAMPLAAQVQVRRIDEARRQLAEARDTVLGFAAAHGRLPCPATLAEGMG